MSQDDLFYASTNYEGNVAYIPIKQNSNELMSSTNEGNTVVDGNLLRQIKIIDPKELSISKLKKICEYAATDFTIVQGYQHPKGLQELSKQIGYENITLDMIQEDFLISFRSDTENLYRRSFKLLFEMGIVSKNCSIDEFIAFKHAEFLEKIKNTIHLKESKKRACITVYCSFAKYISKQLGVMLELGSIKKDSYKSEYQNQPLTLEEWNRFIIALKEVNEREALVAQVLNYANGCMNKLPPPPGYPSNLAIF